MYVLMYVLPIFCFRLTYKVDGLLYIDLLLLQCRLNLRKFFGCFQMSFYWNNSSTTKLSATSLGIRIWVICINSVYFNLFSTLIKYNIIDNTVKDVHDVLPC